MADLPFFTLDADSRWRLAFDAQQWVVQRRRRAPRRSERAGISDSGWRGVSFVGSTKTCRWSSAAREYEAERVSIFTLRTALYQRARCVQSNPAPERSKALETGTRTDGPLAGGAEAAR